MRSLHSQIMNIPCEPPKQDTYSSDEFESRKYGHKQARHAAAELALKYDTFVEAMRRIAESGDVGEALDAHLKRLDGESP